jgi:hypothetical protein
MARWEAKKNATEVDVRRMYLRGREGVLKLKGLPLECALAETKVSPKRPTAKTKPLDLPKVAIRVVPPSEVPQPKPPKKNPPWSVGRGKSGSVLRPKFPPSPSVPRPAASPDLKQTTSSKPMPKAKKKVAAQGGATTAAMKPGNRKRRTILLFDGLPRFEGGMRIVQAGRYESRR